MSVQPIATLKPGDRFLLGKLSDYPEGGLHPQLYYMVIKPLMVNNNIISAVNLFTGTMYEFPLLQEVTRTNTKT